MATDLRELTSGLMPDYTLGVIRQAIKTDTKYVWVVVEGDDDVEIYRNFFDDRKAKVRNSADEEQQKGCEHVESIVSEVMTEDRYSDIIGIRDTDYTRYNSHYKAPAHVFLTDNHDIEMTILDDEDTLSEMEKRHPGFQTALAQTLPQARKIGLLRAYNYLCDTGFSFKKHIKESKIWNKETHAPQAGWEDTLHTVFFQKHNDKEPDREEYAKVKGQLEKEPDTYVCQGHDVVRMLEWAGRANNLCDQFPQVYTLPSFQKTSLCHAISHWAAENGKSEIIKR